jgi:hypothetical protein
MIAGEMAVADRHYQEMRRLEAFAVALLQRAWSKVDPNNLDESWAREAARVFTPFVNLQLQAATLGAAYAAAALIAQGIRVRAEAKVRPETLAGWASDGRPLESLLAAPADVAVQVAPEQALDAGRASVNRIARTQIADASRVAAGMDRVTRPRVGWVRMLTPPSCSRCLILAGRFYRWSDGFDRHPNDDCISVPAEEDRAGDLRTDPDAYLKSLPAAEQDRILGKANAQAWRDGADLNQVVNAKRGMQDTTVFGQQTQITTEGTTTRGLAGQRLISQGARVAAEQGEFVRRHARGGEVTRRVRRQRVQVPRLTPESIYKFAKDRDDALRLLYRFGYIL